MTQACVLALCLGPPAPLPDGKISSIDKHAADGPVRVLRLGLEGDTQSNRKYHGGEHMALHHYPADHYSHWLGELPAIARLKRPGAFGENVHARGLTESAVMIGDRFRLGSALLEVSMGRQPCVTLARHFQHDGMVAHILANHRCGWYYRVLEEGNAQAGDTLSLVERVQDRWSIERAFVLLFDRARSRIPGEVSDLLSLAALAPDWRKKAAARQ